MINGFRIQVIIRVIMLSATIGLLSYIITNTEYIVSSVLVGVVILIQIFALIQFIETTNTKLKRFFEAISYNDFSQTFFSTKKADTFSELGEVFNKVIEKFKTERSKSEESFRYLQTVVQHIGIGLFSFNQNGEIELLNTAAKRLLDINVLRSVQQLGDIDENLLKGILDLNSGARTLIDTVISNQRKQLAVSATEFRMKGDNYKLISLQNITSELDEKEMEAWQNLTQVLAHEIMNSITPIASLSDTVNTMLMGDVFGSEAPEAVPEETLDDVKDALATINKRSLGLMRFVNSYRNITQLPQPVFEVLPVIEVLSRVSNLMKGEATQQRVNISIQIEPDTLEITADSQLIDQALINIVKNAFKALREIDEPTIELKGYLDLKGRPTIEVIDNGPGIKPAVLEKIFVPFYTTSKSAEIGGGTGIGLSLSRQIMRMHSGTLRVSHSQPGKTVFEFRF